MSKFSIFPASAGSRKRRDNFQFSINNQKTQGQIVLILVLVTVVGLTIGLSLISRTISDIRISSQIEQSSRAFSAAEAGVESALKGSALALPTGTVTLNGAQAAYSVQSLGGGAQPYTFSYTQPGEVQSVWLTSHKANGEIDMDAATYPPIEPITICWGSVGTTKPALILSFIYQDGTVYKVAKASYDSDSSRANGFASTDATNAGCPTGFLYRKIVNPNGDLGIINTAKMFLMRIQVVYQGTELAVIPSGAANLPLQGELITSIGQTNTGIVRRIQVTKGYSVLPFLLDFAFFSEN